MNERHEAMVILGYAALWHKAYARGIRHLQTIIKEQLEQKEPSARHLVGAYQNLSTLYAQERKWAESVAAAEAALTWWKREAPERRTCRRAGVEVTLVEALANAGRYAEAEERLQRMMDAGEVERTAYSDVLRQIQFYRAAPEMRDWSRTLLDVSY